MTKGFWLGALLATISTSLLAQSGSFTEYPIPTANSEPFGITAGPDSALWFTESNSNKIGRIDPLTKSITEYPIPTADSQPYNITRGPDGALWFTEFNGNKIGRIDPTTLVINDYPTPTDNSAPEGIVAGPDNALWFTEFGASQIGRIDSVTKSITEYATLHPGPEGIAVGPDGALWYTENFFLGRIDPSTKSVSDYGGGILQKYSQQSITLGPDGALWYTPPQVDPSVQIARFDPATNVTTTYGWGLSQIIGITAAKGKLWFSELKSLGAAIGEIDPATGSITQYPIPTANSYPYPHGITGGPDGAVWFTEATGNQIERFEIGSGPSITQTIPSSIPAGSPDTAVRILGSGLLGTASATNCSSPPTAVTWNGTNTTVTSSTPTEVDITVPAALLLNPGPAAVAVTVTNFSEVCSPRSASTTIQITSQIISPTPALSNINPTSGTACGPNFTLTLNGSNFQTGASVRFGKPTGVDQLSPIFQGCAVLPAGTTGQTILSCTQMTALVPAAAVQTAGLASVYAANLSASSSGGYVFSNPIQFPINPTPFIQQIVSPASLQVGSGDFQLTLNIANYIPGVTSVRWGTPSGFLSLLSATQVSSFEQVAVQVPAALIPTAPGPVQIGVVNVDGANPNGTAYPATCSPTRTFMITPPGPALQITTVLPLPKGTVNTLYSQPLAATGGTPPYTWSLRNPPSWLTVNSTTGVLSGTPPAANTYAFTVTVTDRALQTASVQFTLTINSAPVITTASLPPGTVNVPYSQPLAATGGTPPYTWTSGNLPPWLALGSTGLLSGTPPASNTYAFTVTVTDQASLQASQTYSLVVNLPELPSLQVSVDKQPTTITDQPGLTISLGGAYPATLSATLSLSFIPNASTGLPAIGYVDPGLMFATSNAGSHGLQTTITLPAGQTSVPLPTSSEIQIGSVAGTIMVTLTGLTATSNGQTQSVSLPNSPPSLAITVPLLRPVITPGSVRITNVTASGFTVELQASSTPRDITSASVDFTAATGTQLNSTSFTVNFDSAATNWFASDKGKAAGGTFALQIPFTFSGDASTIGSVSVKLTNSVDTSAAVSGGK